jgi:hypothetical protein
MKSKGLIFLFVLIFLISISFISASLFGYNSPSTSVTIGGNKTSYINITNTYTTIGGMGVNLTQMDNSTVINIKETWLTTFVTNLFDGTLFRNFFNQDLNTTANVKFNSVNVTGGYIWNGSDRFSFTDLNATGTGEALRNYFNQNLNKSDNATFGFVNLTTGYLWNGTDRFSLTDLNLSSGLSSADVNATINTYLGNANATYLSTYNKTYDDYKENVSRNWTINANSYTDAVNASQSSWIETVFLKIVNFLFPKPDNVYLYNDSTTIYFNETKLNETIRIEGLRIGFNITSEGLTSQQINASIRTEGLNLGFNVTNNDTIRDFGLQLGFNITNNNTIRDEGIRIGFNNTYNKTYHDYALNVSINYTLQTYNTYDARWLDGNVTFNQSLTSSLYAPNTTAGIQFLINSTGVYSTFNLTYDAYRTNVSINHTEVTFNTYNATWDNNFMNLWNYNQTTDAITYLINTYNVTWSSTFNSTYNANMGNASFNQTITDMLYIKKTNESNLNVNYSFFWGVYNSTNSTQFESQGGRLNLLWTWFVSKWNELFRNFFNQNLNSTANVTFAGINISEGYFYNSSGGRFSLNDLNTTGTGLTSQQINDSIKTYGIGLGFNVTNNNTIRDEGIRIGFNLTYNSTYDSYKTNVSINYTKQTFDTYNSTWDNNWVVSFAGYANLALLNNSNNNFSLNINVSRIYVMDKICNSSNACFSPTELNNTGSASSGVPNYQNLALINQSNIFTASANISGINNLSITGNFSVSNNLWLGVINLLSWMTGIQNNVTAVNNSAYQNTNPSDFWNWTAYTNCSAGTYAVNFSRAGFQCLSATASGVAGYTNIAQTNQSNIFTGDANITIAGNLTVTKNIYAGDNITTVSWFHGLFDWVLGLFGVGSVSNKYLVWNGTTLGFNETYLNFTIGLIANVSANQIANVINSTSNWMGVNDSRLMTINTSANFQVLGKNTNLSVNNLNITLNLTLSNDLVFPNNNKIYYGNKTIYSNATCIIIKGQNSTLEIC